MGDITDGINGFFWLSLTTLLCGGIGVFIRFFYKSKCSEVSCGCFKVKRDVEIEKEEDLVNPPSPTNDKII